MDSHYNLMCTGFLMIAFLEELCFCVLFPCCNIERKLNVIVFNDHIFTVFKYLLSRMIYPGNYTSYVLSI